MVIGGLFYGYKFFLIIGKYVVEMFDGIFKFELVKIWVWDKENNGEVYEGMFLMWEMVDV